MGCNYYTYIIPSEERKKEGGMMLIMRKSIKNGELTDLLRQEGYKFTSTSNSDFYSDGLRFAGFTDFS